MNKFHCYAHTNGSGMLMKMLIFCFLYLPVSTYTQGSTIDNLEVTNLTIESIHKLDPNIFKPFENLETLYLDLNFLREIPKNLFENNKKLSVVSITNYYDIPNIPSALFANPKKLKHVRLVCGLTSVSQDLFSKSTALETISLAYNKLTFLPSQLFESQSELTRLDLSHNQLSKIQKEWFQNAWHLKVLNMSDNQLTEIQSDVLSDLILLKILDLSNNRLTTISPNAFAYNQLLTDVNLGNNQLFQHYTLQSLFKYTPHLQILNLRNNSIENFFDEWTFQLTNLRKLDLSDNNITTISENYFKRWNANNLNINLTHNQVQTLQLQSPRTLDFPSHKRYIKLYLDSNSLQCHCILLNFLQYLSVKPTLHFAHGNHELNCNRPKTLRHNHEDKNYVCPLRCNCSVRCYDKMLMVNCSNASLSKIPALPSIKPFDLVGIELNMRNNKIEKLPPSTTSGYADVMKLNLSKNYLTILEEDKLPANLKGLDVRDNQLTSLNNSTIHFLNNTVNELHLSGNPWVFSCEETPLIMCIKNNNGRLQDLTEEHINKFRFCFFEYLSSGAVLLFVLIYLHTFILIIKWCILN